MPENKVISLEERAKDEQKPFLPLPVLIHSILVELLVVRNGHLPEREVISGAGPIPVCQPRVRHRDQGRFSSAILPKCGAWPNC